MWRIQTLANFNIKMFHSNTLHSRSWIAQRLTISNGTSETKIGQSDGLYNFLPFSKFKKKIICIAVIAAPTSVMHLAAVDFHLCVFAPTIEYRRIELVSLFFRLFSIIKSSSTAYAYTRVVYLIVVKGKSANK